MLGVLLNLILGLSRVLLAMGRRGDMPAATAKVDAATSTPRNAVVIMGVVIAALVLLGGIALRTILVAAGQTSITGLF